MIKMKYIIEIGPHKLELASEEAEQLYDELKKSFEPKRDFNKEIDELMKKVEADKPWKLDPPFIPGYPPYRPIWTAPNTGTPHWTPPFEITCVSGTVESIPMTGNIATFHFNRAE